MDGDQAEIVFRSKSAAMKKRVTIKALAKRRCDAARRKNPSLWFFLDDPACIECVRWARAKIRKEVASMTLDEIKKGDVLLWKGRRITVASITNGGMVRFDDEASGKRKSVSPSELRRVR